MSKHDDEDIDPLLRRLNALKPSSLTLGIPKSRLDRPAPSASPHNGRPSDLTARFAALSRGGRSSDLAAEEVAAHPELLNPDVEGHDPFQDSGASLDDLLADLELGDVKDAVGDEEWKSNKVKAAEARELLKEARATLKAADAEDDVDRSPKARPANESKEDPSGCDASPIADVDEAVEKQGFTEADEADEFVRKVLGEALLDDRDDKRSDQSVSGDKDEQTDSTEERADSPDLSLPAAPTVVPTDPAEAEDSLSLPAAPTYQPTSLDDTQSSIPSDEDVETWCDICMDDASLQCVDCDGMLYCDRCWNEGHKGESAGPEERRHKALLYENPKKKRQRDQKARERKRKVRVGAG